MGTLNQQLKAETEQVYKNVALKLGKNPKAEKVEEALKATVAYNDASDKEAFVANGMAYIKPSKKDGE